MSNIVLRVENLSKQYRLGVVGSGTLRDDVARWIAKARGKEDPTLKVGETNTLDTVEGEYVWALQDINFEVKQGEILGIIGKNGAGKSTLLKILSKITGPTTGTIKAKGRIASLLEVGTGMHPELTGRENIFLNGAILGMTKAKIRRKLDEIIDFAGIAKYVDTPIKRYSSGMSVRLGFAVAAFLEPEILIVDEVLAVGDAEFQKKAIGKMQDVSKGQGRTVLFVSHNMGSVKNLCTRGIVLKTGSIAYQGDISKTIEYYLTVNQSEVKAIKSWKDDYNRSNEMKLLDITSYGLDRKIKSNFQPNEEVFIEIRYELLEQVAGMRINLSFKTSMGEIAFISTSHEVTKQKQEVGQYKLICKVPINIFNLGQYTVFLSAGIPGQRVIWQSNAVMNLHIEGIAQHGSNFQEKWPGVLAPILEWKVINN